MTDLCPHCRQPVSPKAYVCPHCRKRLRMSEGVKAFLIVAAFALLCIVAAGIVIRHDNSMPAPTQAVMATMLPRATATRKKSPIDVLAKNFEDRGFSIIEGTQAFTLAGEKGVIVNLVSYRWDTMDGNERRQFLHIEAWKACEAELGVDFIEFRSAGKNLGRLEHSIFHEP